LLAQIHTLDKEFQEESLDLLGFPLDLLVSKKIYLAESSPEKFFLFVLKKLKKSTLVAMLREKNPLLLYFWPHKIFKDI